MAKKKKASDNDSKDKKQTSLFSFREEKKPQKTEIKKKKVDPPKQKKESIETSILQEEMKGEIHIPKKTELSEEETSPKEKKISRKIPEELFFQGNEEPFGVKAEEVDLEKIKREGFSSRYLRYLIEKGDILQNLKRGFLLDVDYDGGQNKAYCKFYDLDTDEIKIWIDTTEHIPYCLTKHTIQELESNIDLTNYSGLVKFEKVKKYDLLRDQEIEMTKIYGESPTDIGGSGTNIKNILGGAWEANIRYHLNYIYDRALIPGLVYEIKEGEITQIDYRENNEEYEDVSAELKELFKDEAKEIQDFSKKYSHLFLTPIPEVNRMALDIEVNMGPGDYLIPNPKQAKQDVISISFVASDGLKRVYILEREGFIYGNPHKNFPEDAEVTYFKSEKNLLIETFRLMWQYPVILTFNGDNFDLNYLFHRANRLKIEKDLNPIYVKRGFGFLSKAECYLRRGIHIDLFNFFFNRSISGYAFGGAYQKNSLNAISAALLSDEKYQHEEEIHQMEYNILAWYNLKDSILTLELTQFNNSLVWNLIILLCRITKMPIHDMVRHQISSWIQNIFYYEHRQQNYLIPLKEEISQLKQGGYSKSTVDGKGFKGAYVVPPVPGIHFDVVVMDFSSLYPTIIKEYNLSYETVQCPHQDCIDNMPKGIPYHVCNHKMGIFAYVVGFLRDVRVKYFKPKSYDQSLTQKRRDYYTTIQQALKVFINGAYGVFGSRNFPLFCLPVAESTTGIGQYSIKKTIEKSESMGVDVLYGDTDSVFLANPSPKQMERISEWSKKELDLDLEEEKTYQFLALSERKKNYVGIYKDSGYVDIKGLLAKKRNTPDFIKKIFSNLIEHLKVITNEKEFKDTRDEIVAIVRENLRKIGKPGAFDLEDYAVNIGIQKSLDKYTKVIPQHVRAALELKKITGKEFQKGEVISFVKTKTSDGAKALELAKLQDLDIKKYRELLKSALEQVLDALGITWQEIKGIKKMDSFF
ncbi:MAG: DNA-directed DNA polymerase I [Candidatus Lokiarchaeota archaeon]|nr:DNA-directed DNA polymerase I [Candidatus Lokiarchaeota archaeon]MBD3202647.1 DNA-directed DNA polymerase I [Candidatus Lokiarchaeota archaeon]